jgi:hypothetical protein
LSKSDALGNSETTDTKKPYKLARRKREIAIFQE